MLTHQLEHITTTTCLLVEGILRQRLGHVPSDRYWNQHIDMLDAGNSTWVILHGGTPILQVHFNHDGEASWKVLEGETQLN